MCAFDGYRRHSGISDGVGGTCPTPSQSSRASGQRGPTPPAFEGCIFPPADRAPSAPRLAPIGGGLAQPIIIGRRIKIRNQNRSGMCSSAISMRTFSFQRRVFARMECKRNREICNAGGPIVPLRVGPAAHLDDGQSGTANRRRASAGSGKRGGYRSAYPLPVGKPCQDYGGWNYDGNYYLSSLFRLALRLGG